MQHTYACKSIQNTPLDKNSMVEWKMLVQQAGTYNANLVDAASISQMHITIRPSHQ